MKTNYINLVDFIDDDKAVKFNNFFKNIIDYSENKINYEILKNYIKENALMFEEYKEFLETSKLLTLQQEITEHHNLVKESLKNPKKL